MGKRIVIGLILLNAVTLRLAAQTGYSNLEFIENKGQWDSRVNFRAEINAGAFFLQPYGFTVLLQNADDLKKIQELNHGHFTALKADKADKALSKKTPPITPIENSIIRSHAYQVSFVGANNKVEIIPDKSLPTYNNYFIGNDKSKWRSNCQIFQGITYKNIYPNIDLRYYSYNGQLKYDIIVHPGGNPDNISMKYEGADKLSIQNNQLIIKTSVGNVKELEPHSYQLAKTGRSDVECKYVLGPGSTVRFKIKNYSPDKTLIIDPTLVFVTFTGSTSDNWGYTATYDEAGNFYSGSIVLDVIQGNGNGFPTTTGAFQTSFQGGDTNVESGYAYDVAIMKFSSNGSNRMYATYIGGDGNEQPHSLIVDNTGALIIAGRTNSSNFPVTENTFGPGGLFDIFITKLNASGTALIGSREFGGRGDDGVNIAPKYSTNGPQGTSSLRLNYGDDGRSEVIIDGANNIYLASCTRSTDFLTVNAFQPNPGTLSGNAGVGQDGVVIKTNPNLSNVLFSSYLGGSGDDAAFVLALNPNDNNIYVAGGTASTDLKGTGNGPVLYNSLQGGVDGFVSIISNDGSTLIKTSYFGTAGTEVIYGVQFDKKGFPYIMGTTTGTTWPVTPAGIFSQARGKQFIAKLEPDLSAFKYSTVFGSGGIFPNISPTAFLVDNCENVYVSGWGGGIDIDEKYDNNGTQGLSVTANPIKSSTDGSDFYFFILQKNAASQLYGSFFGQDGAFGDHVDGGTSRFDKQGIIYQAVCANCYGGAAFPVTPGVWSSLNGTGSSGCNLAAVKIAFNFAGVISNVKAYINSEIDTAGCSDITITFKDTIGKAQFYVWNYDTSNHSLPRDTTKTPQIDHQYPTKGVYTVRLIAVDSNTCNITDTSYVTVKIGDIHAYINPAATVIGDCRDLNYQFQNLTTTTPNHPNPPFTDSSFTWDFGDGTVLKYGPGNPPPHKYPSPGTYTVVLTLSDNNYCNSPEKISLNVKVAQFIKASFTAPLDACINTPVSFLNSSISSDQFLWNFGDGGSSQESNPTYIYTKEGTYKIKLVATDPTTCNGSDSAFVTITVHSKPQAAFTNEPVPAQINKPTIFTNNSVGANHFKWFFGDGDSAIKASTDTVIHQYQRNGPFNACLIAYNQFECPDTACHSVDALITPLLDVPNAFTPGRFGQNGIVKVKGFGIATMVFRIYNRWGQKVFETNNPEQGWDGTYKGVLQPMDVYGYTLEANYFDGTKTTKKGDITLIR